MSEYDLQANFKHNRIPSGDDLDNLSYIELDVSEMPPHLHY